MTSKNVFPNKIFAADSLTRINAGRLFAGLFFFLVFTVPGCTAQKAQRLNKQTITLERAAGPLTIKAEIARTDEERAMGLMYRTELADGEGMLFVFDRDEILSFWMKNTLIPLSIAFIASDGRIMEIRDLEPGNLAPVKSSRSVRYALEMPRGWFDRVNVTAGDRLIPEASWW